ncbi:MAG: hypothetical protein NZ518_08210, partial [Dehalococcoidia bacterium]|nr:hypothetical protein [Dehalococcoidia bacterium]
MARPVFTAAVVQRGADAVTGARDVRVEMAENRDAMIRWLDLLQHTATPPRLVVFPVLSVLG